MARETKDYFCSRRVHGQLNDEQYSAGGLQEKPVIKGKISSISCSSVSLCFQKRSLLKNTLVSLLSSNSRCYGDNLERPPRSTQNPTFPSAIFTEMPTILLRPRWCFFRNRKNSPFHFLAEFSFYNIIFMRLWKIHTQSILYSSRSTYNILIVSILIFKTNSWIFGIMRNSHRIIYSNF